MLLTGATGFIGSHVTQVLAEAECDVYALIRPGSSLERLGRLIDAVHVVPGDLHTLAHPAALKHIDPDVCLHLAWYAEPGRYLHAVRENLACLRASLDLVEALAEAGCPRLLVTGTCAEYGQATEDRCFSETDPIRPTTPYARAKAALHLAAQDTAAAAGMSLAWARLFFLYGPWEQQERVVPAATRACLRREHFPATAGEQVRDYLHVADAARGLWAVAKSDLHGPVNVCAGEAVTLRSLLEAVEEAAGAPGTIGFGDKPYLPSEWTWMRGSNEVLLSTGWIPRFHFQSGITDTVAWWARRTSLPTEMPPSAPARR